MPIVAIGFLILALSGAAFVAWIFIILHAFGRSVGTGFLVLLVPCYILYYSFSQFEHARKGVIVGLFIGCGAMAAMLYGAALAEMPSQLQMAP